jgi:hypothetical protein
MSADGGQAFPIQAQQLPNGEVLWPEPGMTLRDYFERQAGVRIVRIDDIDAAWDAALQEAAERGLLDSLHAPSRNVAPITRKGR